MTNSCDKIELQDVNLEDLHFEQRLWINKIKFYKEQIDILQKDLDKMVKYYYDPEAMAEVEQYQNKFIVYHEVADNLIKDYKNIRNRINEFVDDQDGDFKQEIVDLKNKACEKTMEFLSFIEELKDNFMLFYTSYYVSENHIFN